MSLAQPITRRIARMATKNATRPQTRQLFGFPSPFASQSTSSSSLSSSPSTAKGTLTKRGNLSIYEESREMSYTPQQLYSVIADVDAYDSFLPFTTSSRILSSIVTSPSAATPETRLIESKGWLSTSGEKELWVMKGELKIGAMGYQESYISDVKAKKFEFVSATANDSNIFKHLETKWTLVPLSGGPTPRTRVDLYLAYAFISPFHAAAVSAVWERVSGLMVDGFEKRMKSVYNP